MYTSLGAHNLSKMLNESLYFAKEQGKNSKSFKAKTSQLDIIFIKAEIGAMADINK